MAGLAAAAGAFAFYTVHRGSEPLRAVIIDQLASTDANPSFIKEATGLLQGAGYRVDYVPPEQVSVDYYRDLPRRGYTFMIIRSHSYGFRGSIDPATGRKTIKKDVGLFTTEPYRIGAHLAEQRARELDISIYNGGGPELFGVAAPFVAREMRGRFPHSTILLMGCQGLTTDSLADAFMARGARSFIGWDDEVTAEHTDAVSLVLLGRILEQHMDVSAAVESAAQELGPDPVYGGRLALRESPAQ